jgi:hypothetical protein
MGQRPIFSNDHVKNLNDLYDLLSNLEKFGFVHEEFHQDIDFAMADLYDNAVDLYKKSQLEGESYTEEEYESVSLPHFAELFDFVESGDEAQYIEDLQNIMGIKLMAWGCLSDDLSEQALQRRDPGYITSRTIVDTDFHSRSKYQMEPRSVWFPAKIQPMRKGVYEVSETGYEEPKMSGYAFWDGKIWHQKCFLLDECRSQTKDRTTISYFGYSWRGLLRKSI